MPDSLKGLGIVVIGRNEGERLKRCLHSIQGRPETIVYVDSGSTDGSVAFALSLEVVVVQLDMTRPFTMARGRNAGFKRLLEVDPAITLVQFVDGDCEVVEGYLEAAVRTMNAHPEVSVVTGRRRERYPEQSKYNRLCDIEWGRDLGEINACGGDLMIRAQAFKDVGLFNQGMIAGEEPELCVRLRKAGGKIVRIDYDMTIHDAAIHTMRQWWKRLERSGHATAEGAAIHGRSPERHKVGLLRTTIVWGLAMPLVAILTLVISLWEPVCLFGLAAVLCGYFILSIKIFRFMVSKGYCPSDARLYSFWCILGKFPSMIGIMQYLLNRLRRKQSELIEYKDSASGSKKVV